MVLTALFLCALQSSKEDCGGSIQQWIKTGTMGECVSYFLNETVKTLYNDEASAFLGVVAIDPLSNFNVSNQSTTCRKRADNFATLTKSTQAFYKNFTEDTVFPVGEIGTTLVDLYALNNSFSKLD